MHRPRTAFAVAQQGRPGLFTEFLCTRSGHETDLVLAYRPSSDIKLSLTFGHFRPGSGFGDNRDSAWFGQAKVGYRF